MSSSQAIASVPQSVPGAVDCGALAGGEPPRAAKPQALSETLGLRGKDSLAGRLIYQQALQPQRTSNFAVELNGASGGLDAGYAQAAAGLAASAAGGGARSSSSKTSSKTTKATSTSGEWGFLNDTHMSVEDKLFLFIELIQKKTDQELDKKMKEYRDKYCSTSSNKKSDDGGGLLGFLGNLFSGGWLWDAFEQIGGLLLKAGGAALGLTPLGSVLTTVGKELGRAAASAIGVKKASSSSSTEKKEDGSPDERLDMLEIQRLADKQKQMFDCVSNILRVIHETAMTAVGNIR